MNHFLSGPEFGKQIAYRFGLYVALTFVVPFVVLSAILWLNFASANKSVIEWAVTFGSYGRLAGFVLFLGLLISPCWHRMRSLGLPPSWGLIVPLLLFLSGGTFVLICVLALVVALWLMSPPGANEPAGLARFGQAGVVTAILMILLIAVSTAGFVVERWIVPTTPAEIMAAPQSAVRKLWHGIQWLKLFVGLAVSALLAWLTFVSQSEDEDNGAPVSAPETPADIGSEKQNSPMRVVFGKR